MPTADIRRSRRIPGPAASVLMIAGVVAVVWAPSFVAVGYAEGQASGHLANPASGWAFLWEAVTASRNPRLGTADAAMQQASQVWAGAPAVASGAALKTIPAIWDVPVPAGGVEPAGTRGEARPDHGLNWVVTGRVRGGPEQVIGLLDYRTGHVEWDIRPVPGESR